MAGLETDRILEELSRHWAAIGKERGEGEGVVRACALTLVVFAEESDDAAAIGETLAQLMREHPNRAIVVRVRPGDKPFLGHNVFSQCWRPLGRGEQICCERIEITASEASLADVAPVLVALRAPDLPTVLWYRSARIFDTPTLGASAFPGCKLIVDSDPSDPSRMLKRLAAAGPLVADLAWTRLTRWRATIAQLFESADCYELLPRLDHMRVLYSGERVPAQAFYMAAWILDSLGREIKHRFEAVEGHFGLEGVELSAGAGGRVSMRRFEEAALIETDGVRNCTGLPRLTEPEMLTEELSVFSARDPVFTRALKRAARLASERK